jgi:hypothetical protein
MAEPLDPNLYYATAEEAVNAGAASPAEKRFFDWANSAKVGDTFDQFASTGLSQFKGSTSKLVGYNSQGKPIIESLRSPEVTNWRAALVGATSMDEAVNRLVNLGYDINLARSLVNTRTKGKGSGGIVSGITDGDGDGSGGGAVFTAPDGKTFNSESALNAYLIQLDTQAKQTRSLAAFEIFRGFLRENGIEALAADVEKYKLDGLSDEELLIRLRTESDAYKNRFAANQSRIAKGLRALSEAEYIGLEDQYQDVMRRYGLPASYYTKGDMGVQPGFEKFIAGDVSPVELEDRIQTAQNRVINANPEVAATLRQFYPQIGQGELLAYFLDPEKALPEIQRKVTAAEIGGAATMSGLATGVTRAEQLASYGVTGEAARQGFQTIAEILPRGSQLAEIYKQSPYNQATAEQEVFGLAGATEASKRRRQLTQLEQAAFSGSAGTTGGALGRERAGAF